MMPSFDENTFISVLEVDKELFDFKKFRRLADEKGLLEKPSLHITIIGRETGEFIRDNIKNLPDFKDLVGEIKKILDKENWRFSKTDEIYYIEKVYKEYDNEKRKSLIQFIEMPALKSFYEKLNRILPIKLEIPVPHVTLFANSDREETKLRGIGIYSTEQFKSLNPELLK